MGDLSKRVAFLFKLREIANSSALGWVREDRYLDDRPMGPRARRAYLRWHMRTDPDHAMYQASVEQIAIQGDNYLMIYAISHHLEYE